MPKSWLAFDEEFDFRRHYFYDRGTQAEAYKRAFKEPRYPVPALRTRVNLFGDVVIIWNHHTHRAAAVWVKGERNATSID